MREFWVASGHHLTRRADHGGLVATPELIMAYLARPELMPPADACEAERNLHASLLADPLRPISKADIAALADADARENWTFMMDFRDRLIAAPSLEAVYTALARNGVGDLPRVQRVVDPPVRGQMPGQLGGHLLGGRGRHETQLHVGELGRGGHEPDRGRHQERGDERGCDRPGHHAR